MKNSPKVQKAALEVLEELINMPDEEFQKELEKCKNDPLTQIFMRMKVKLCDN